MNDPLDLARAVQREAADPRFSVALAAAAGSGKTKVLVDRYLRLCLEGADPRSIVAVTFTRKATVEIRQRLLQEVLDLARAEPPRSARAAWLLESLLEDPAGLAVDTIHAFCQQIIGRFAAEAGLDPHYGILERETDLQDEALDRLEEELAGDAAAAAEFARLAASPADARRRIAALFGQRVHLQRWLDRVVPPPLGPAAALVRPLSPCVDALAADLAAALPPAAAGTAPASALAGALRIFAGAGLAAVEAADGGSPTDGLRKWRDEIAAEFLAAAERLAADPDYLEQALAGVAAALLTGGKLRRPVGRKNSWQARLDAFAAAAQPLVELLQSAAASRLLAENTHLLRHGLRALDLYRALKQRDRVLDFQDLEYLALRLLTDDEMRLQVHQRLDARLDHLLLDEFQDTNRNQWDLLCPLLLELLAGGDPPRTGFIVGDVKQSIYGFRAADPTIFQAAARAIAGADGRVLALPTNFRSLPAVVETVGTLFQHEPLRSLLGAEFAPGAQQLPVRRESRGEVVLVDPFERDDTAAAHDAAAEAVVRLVTWLAAGRCALGDILVLCRSKTHIARYEMALRRAGVPLVPAGRGLLARSREVQDILALLRWLTFPADDVAGAAVLRSPLARAPEATVQALLAARLSRPGRRRRTLWDLVQAAADLAPLAELLRQWHQQAGLTPLHDLLRRIYRGGEVLARMEIALGEQARFNLLRLADIALAVEATGGSPRDLAAELERAALLGGEDEGALPGDEGGRLRLMTVHAAKGLEAPVVILIDAAAEILSRSDLLPLGREGPWAFNLPGELVTGPQRHDGTCLPAPLAEPAAAAVSRQLAEEAHILYVAMTRTRDRLYVLGAHGKTAPKQSYHVWLTAAGAAAASVSDSTPPWRRLGAPQFMAELAAPAGAAALSAPDPADRARARLRRWTPPPLPARLRVENASRLAPEDRSPGRLERGDEREGDDLPPPPVPPADAATSRGTRIHLWLERAVRAGAMPPGEGDEWEEAAAVFANPDLAWIFRPENGGGRGLCEQPVLHRCGLEGRTEVRMLGTIDRLVLRPDRVEVIDYKSDRVDAAAVAGRAAHYRPQLAAYRDALAVLWPSRQVSCWLIFTHATRGGMLVAVDPEAAPCP